MLPGFDTLYLITRLHGKRSLLHEHTNDGAEVSTALLGFFFLVPEHMRSPRYVAQHCHGVVCLFQHQERLFLWLARGESWLILEPYATPQPLTQRPCNSHGFMWSCFIGRALCEVLLGRQFHPGSWE